MDYADTEVNLWCTYALFNVVKH